MNAVESYARWILDPVNHFRSGKYIKLVAQRFLDDLKRTDIYFDEEQAFVMINFCEKNCCLWEGDWAGQPMKFEPWMVFVLGQVFGWIRRKDGKRRITKFFVQISKKNSKTTGILGMLNVFHLFRDDRVSTPQILVGANNEEQAKICVNITGQIILASPRLRKFVEDDRVGIYRYEDEIRHIAHKERKGTLRAMSKESGDRNSKTAGGKQGKNASLGEIDEWGLAQDANLMSAIETSQASRSERLMALTTTAGFNLAGPCYAGTRKVSIDILEGRIKDDSFLPFIYEIDPPVDEKGRPMEITVEWLLEHPEVWEQSNPSIGSIVSERYLQNQLEQARDGLASITDILTLNFNCWMNAPAVWVPRETWIANTHGIEDNELEGQLCYGSLQVTSNKELVAFCLLFPNIRDGIHAVKMMFFMPSKAMTRNKEGVDYLQWRSHIEQCEGNVIDNDFIFDKIIEEVSKYQLHSLSFPVTQERHDIVQALVKAEIVCNPISQGYRGNSEPTFTWEALLTAHQIEHFNNPVLAWSNSQCMAIRKGDDIRVERAGSRTAGIVACINALAQWKTIEAEEEEEAGLTFLDI